MGLRCSSSEAIRRGFGMVQGSIVVVAVEVVAFVVVVAYSKID